MWLRVERILHEQIPRIDLEDVGAKRQLAPEYSASAYEAMVEEEYAIGNYIDSEDCSLKITAAQRDRMVHLIQGLHRKKGYRLETLFLAVSIADRYLSHRAEQGQRAPCAVLLAVTSLLLAAKLNESLKPAFVNMNRLLHSDFSVFVSKHDFLLLERDIVKSLEFSLQYVTPLAFLERLQRVFDLDLEETNSTSRYIATLAREYCLKMQRNATFLEFKPSQIAAAAITLAVKTHFDRKVINNVIGKENE